MAHVWLAQQRRGATIDWVPARGETLPIAAYEARIDERTLVVPAAHVCFRNGYRLDIARHWPRCAGSAAPTSCSTTTSTPAPGRSTSTRSASTSW